MSVSTLGVIGAGVMGSGIAQVAATNGINVLLLDVNEKAVKQGRCSCGENDESRRVHAFGKPLSIEEISIPTPGPGEVLIKVLRAASVIRTSTPWTAIGR